MAQKKKGMAKPVLTYHLDQIIPDPALPNDLRKLHNRKYI
jgi:hypothetical protein